MYSAETSSRHDLALLRHWTKYAMQILPLYYRVLVKFDDVAVAPRRGGSPFVGLHIVAAADAAGDDFLLGAVVVDDVNSFEHLLHLFPSFDPRYLFLGSAS